MKLISSKGFAKHLRALASRVEADGLDAASWDGENLHSFGLGVDRHYDRIKIVLEIPTPKPRRKRRVSHTKGVKHG